MIGFPGVSEGREGQSKFVEVWHMFHAMNDLYVHTSYVHISCGTCAWSTVIYPKKYEVVTCSVKNGLIAGELLIPNVGD